MGIVMSSGTRSPLSMNAFAFLPSSVPFAMFSRKITPVSMWGTPYFFWTMAPWVPLPLPLGPKIRMFMYLSLLS